jgi:hypothetical protein
MATVCHGWTRAQNDADLGHGTYWNCQNLYGRLD